VAPRLGWHPDDREIVALAVPALGALAADPLYSLADTAFVGNLGTPELGAVAVATAAFTASFWLFSFLAYGVTPRVARALGAGDILKASRVGVQALLLALVIGAAVTAAGVAFAGPIVSLLGARAEVAVLAEPYLRVRMLAATPVLIVQAGHGWLRGAHDTRTPMVIALAGAGANVVLDYALIYPAGLGVQGAAWATVIGQTGAALAFVVVLARRMHAPRWRPHLPTMGALITVGADLAVRTGSLLLALTLATSVAARMGGSTLAAWQIALQIFLLLSLAIDALAVPAQAIVARHLGAGAPQRAREVGRRLIAWGLAVGSAFALLLAPTAPVVARLFTDDPGVADGAAGLLLSLALVQPVAAAAFMLDGILIGAGDTRLLAGAMVICSALFVAIAVGALQRGWGTAGLAAGLGAWLAARALTTALRFAGGRWAT
jgi:putative MATE family efflux protein